jgi:hypothetical protein
MSGVMDPGVRRDDAEGFGWLANLKTKTPERKIIPLRRF